MRKSIIFLLLLLIFIWLSAENFKVLVIIPNYYGANYQCLYEMFEQLGWDITTASVTHIVQPCPVYASVLGCPPLAVDLLIPNITNVTEFDCVMIMSSTQYAGNPCIELMNNQETLDLLSTAVNEGLIVWATCSGIRVLAAADILQGINIQGPSSYNNEFIAAGANIVGTKIPPVIDGNIITTMRGQYYMVQNAYAILSALASPEN
ncbi:MAG: DJ-1/PfpI family protein [Candidatus Cloacimonetes bacterium]|nr:DJ-1/PfpI family protein [Candidatus Cloacimonadota bacterium]